MNDTRTDLLDYLGGKCSGEFAFVPGRGWLMRDLHDSPIEHWQADRGALALREAVGHWLREADAAGSDYGGLSVAHRSLSTIAAARELEPLLRRSPGEFDAAPDIAGLASDRFVNLRTGEVAKADGETPISKWLSVSELEEGGPSRWLDVLARALPDAGERDWFRRWCGYCLTGHTREHKFLFLQGPAGRREVHHRRDRARGRGRLSHGDPG